MAKADKAIPNQSDKLSPQPSEPSSAATGNGVSRRIKNLFPLIVAILALGIALVAIYQNRQSGVQYQQLRTHYIALKKDHVEEKSRLKGLQTDLTTLEGQFQDKTTQFNHDLQAASKQLFYQKQDWFLLKVRYYLELAQINAHWNDNQDITKALLKEADALLQEAPLQQLFPIRQAIALEISQLQSFPIIDKAGLLSQLDAASNLVNNLPLAQSLNDPSRDVSNSPELSETKNQWQNSLQLLKKLVIVRYHDSDIKPQFSPFHQALMKDSIRLYFQQAEWAVLHANNHLYQQALTQALVKIKALFDLKETSTQGLIKEIQALQAIDLHSKKPDIHHSLMLLNQYIDTNGSQAPPNKGDTP